MVITRVGSSSLVVCRCIWHGGIYRCHKEPISLFKVPDTEDLLRRAQHVRMVGEWQQEASWISEKHSTNIFYPKHTGHEVK